jgi:hypothetical protein
VALLLPHLSIKKSTFEHRYKYVHWPYIPALLFILVLLLPLLLYQRYNLPYMSKTNVCEQKGVSAVSISTDGESIHKQVEVKVAKGKKAKAQSVPILQLFRFATRKERCMLIVAAIFSVGSGALQPVSVVLYGSSISHITKSLDGSSNLLELTLPIIRSLVLIGTASMVASYISSCLWILTGERQARHIRSLYLHAVLRQDMSWFDQSVDGSLNSRLVSDTQIIQDGISEKFGLFVSLLGQFIAGFVVAFIKGRIIDLM